MIRSVSLLVMCTLVGCVGATLPWEEGDDDGSDDSGGGGGISLPYVPSPLVQPQGIDQNGGESWGIAVGGHEIIAFDPQGASSVASAADKPFVIGAKTRETVDVLASAAGEGDVTLVGHYDGGSGATAVNLIAEPVAAVVVGIPGYRALAAWPALPPQAFLGPEVDGDVRLFDGSGRDLTDTSQAISGANVTPQWWDMFTLTVPAAGPATLSVTGGAIGERALPIDVVDHLDTTTFTNTGWNPPASYDRTICAHGMTGGREVQTTWVFAVSGAETFYPTAAPLLGNCVDVLDESGTTPLTITATAPDGEMAVMQLGGS